MFNFFRNLRHKEMKGSKYLKYAIGEITLVVIGILIALSINNWNEANKARDYELKMLGEIEAALNQDIPVFENFDSLFVSWNHSIIYLINEINNTNESPKNMDSIRYHLNVVDQIGIFAIYNDGPYEALKSSGMDRISNDNLRNDIARVYSRDLPALDIWINEIMRENIFQKYREMDRIFNRNISAEGERLVEELAVNDLSFLKNPEFHDMIRRASKIVNSIKRRMEVTSERLKLVRDDIREEINS